MHYGEIPNCEMIRSWRGVYQGEIDEDGAAHGEGILRESGGLSWQGTFTHGEANGYCKLISIELMNLFRHCEGQR